MSSPNIFADLLVPSNKVGLVKKITAKTKEGKIQWNKTDNGINASVMGKLKLNFVEGSLSFLSQSRWVLFSVRDDKDNEILKVENSSQTVPTSTVPDILSVLLSQDPLIAAVAELHKIVRTEAKGQIEKAIDFLDKI